MELIQAIRERREGAVGRALAMLQLYADADPPTRLSILHVAEKALSEPRVAERWLALLADEEDGNMRERLLDGLSALDFRQVPNASEAVRQLLALLDDADAREWALYCLARIAPHHPALAPRLIEVYHAREDAKLKTRILAMLLLIPELSPELIAFFISVLDDNAAFVKLALVHRLLDLGELLPAQLEKLLSPAEPAALKILVLNHCADRSIRLDTPAAALLRTDADPECRHAALWTLANEGALPPVALDAVFHAAVHDTDDRVRQLAISAFEHTLTKTPTALSTLLEGLRREKSVDQVRLILRLLTPHLHRSPETAAALQALAEQNLQTDIALEVYAALGDFAVLNPPTMDWLASPFSREQNDRVKAAILKPLSTLNANDPRVAKLCVDAVGLPDSALQQWGLQGLLLQPATTEQLAALGAGAQLLLSPVVSRDLKIAFANKLAIVPGKSAALLARLKEVAEQTNDSELKRVCESACNAAQTDALDPAEVQIDWESWIHRAEIEHRCDGIFPAMYEHFDAAPAKARRVLKALLNPQCSDSLYSAYGYDVNEGVILNYLLRKNGVDDDVSRFCLGRALTQDAGAPGTYLRCLAANSAFSGLKDGVLQILEKRLDAPPAALRVALLAAHGDDAAASQALIARIATVRHSDALRPYARFITENLGWPPAVDVLTALSKRFAALNVAGIEAQLAVAAALERFDAQPPERSGGAKPAKQEGGFADE